METALSLTEVCTLASTFLVTSAKEVMFQRRSFICLFAGLPKQPIFIKFGGKVEHGPRKKPLDFGGNPGHVTLGLDRVRVRLCFVVTIL